MKFPEILRKSIITAILFLLNYVLIAQVDIEGTVYDRSQLHPMPGVSVLGTSGAGTATDSLGHYRIRLPSTDSIYFSYLGKMTARFPVKDIPAGIPFDMSLQVYVDSLPTILVRSSNYHMDSLNNRKEYEKIFNYSGPDVVGNNSSGAGMGIDFDYLFNPRKYRRLEAFKERLEWEEREKYVDHRFSRSLVQKITGLQSPALDTFMVWYRPSYDFIQSCETDYEYYKYIKSWSQSFSEGWNETHKKQ